MTAMALFRVVHCFHWSMM